MSVPLLSAQKTARYLGRLGLGQPADERNQRGTALPQMYADRFGWPELVRGVARIVHSLPTTERSRCAIFATNYGRAGAIEYYGRQLGLPRPISNHNSYWLWGPGSWDGQCVVVVGKLPEQFRGYFGQVQTLEPIETSPHAMAYERRVPVSICRGLRIPIAELWPALRHYI